MPRQLPPLPRLSRIRRHSGVGLVVSLIAAAAVLGPGISASATGSTAEPVIQPVLGAVQLRPRPPRWVLPVDGYELTGRFGERSGLWHTVHTGLDFAAPSGTPIRSVGNGTVLSVGYDGRYGYRTVIRLRNGTQLWFCHQSAILVSRGQRVHAGEVIGAVGATGNTTGPHLHLEVRPRPEVPVDPYHWLEAHGLRP